MSFPPHTQRFNSLLVEMLEHVHFSVARLLCTSSNSIINKGNMNTRAFLKLRQHSSPNQEEGSGLVERVRSWRAGQIDTCRWDHRLGKGAYPRPYDGAQDR